MPTLFVRRREYGVTLVEIDDVLKTFWDPFTEILTKAPRSGEYRCQTCGCVFPMGRSDEEAKAELERNFPGMRPEDCGITCDDCFNKIFVELGDDLPPTSV